MYRPDHILAIVVPFLRTQAFELYAAHVEMEVAPPTYEAATLRDPIAIIAPYISSNCLLSAALVSRSWHEVLVTQLWGNPSSHFDTEDDQLHAALSAFVRNLRTVRLSTRERTHTLHLPPDDGARYSFQGPEWLNDVLELLPNLQSLVVRGLSHFDHSSLTNVRLVDRAPFHLRLLDISNCANVTPGALARLLPRCLSLFYLDLSYTPAARQWVVLDNLKHLVGLQVLKLRGLDLDNFHVYMHTHVFGRRIRSLDLSESNITDQYLRMLIEKCLPDLANDGLDSRERHADGPDPNLGVNMLAISQGERFESYIRRIFTSGFVARLAIEDRPDPGATHLYLSGNYITSVGICELLETGTLHVLDVGMQSLYTDRHLTRRRMAPVWQTQSGKTVVAALRDNASGRLRSLRVNHGMLTAPAHSINVDDLVPVGKSTLQAPSSFSSRETGTGSSDASSSSDADAFLHPAMLPHLRTLILTDFPATSPDRKLIDRLVDYITDCATQAAYAHAQAKSDWKSPPGRAGQARTLQHSAEQVFALERIVLELSQHLPTVNAGDAISSAQASKLSMTEEPDSEVLWSAAAGDFSFFEGESGAAIDEANNNDLSRSPPREDSQPTYVPVQSQAQVVDNIAVLSAFRKDRRLAHEQDAATNTKHTYTEGYWPGVVQIVRSASGVHADEAADYHPSRIRQS
ncbi:hypothetical protein LTR95_011822 [Oleoguttula sp. CCFEE 5521]